MQYKRLWIPVILICLVVTTSWKNNPTETTKRINITTDSTYVGTWVYSYGDMVDDLYHLFSKKGLLVVLHYRWREFTETAEVEEIIALTEKRDSLGYVYVPLTEESTDSEWAGEDETAFYIEAATGNLIVRDNFLVNSSSTYVPVPSVNHYVQARRQYLSTCRQNDSLTMGRYVLPYGEWRKIEAGGIVRVYQTDSGAYKAVYYGHDSIMGTWDLKEQPVAPGRMVPVKNYNGDLDSCAVLKEFKFVSPTYLGTGFLVLGPSIYIEAYSGYLWFYNNEKMLGTGCRLYAYDYSYKFDSVFCK